MTQDITLRPQRTLTQLVNAIAKKHNIGADAAAQRATELLRKVFHEVGAPSRNFEVRLDPKLKRAVFEASWAVVEEVKDLYTEVSLSDALKVKPDATIGDRITEVTGLAMINHPAINEYLPRRNPVKMRGMSLVQVERNV